ncbi:MAG: glycosyltransferase family 1 protein [Verrucomicrobiaceae bacterium]|nr:MAG: glycosyltransferase family 1 protein [Verrucomicrobiaceae bacterium]
MTVAPPVTGRRQRWFTCTPVAFGGGADFFARDSGLMCRGFQAIGCESMAVMPGPPQDGDEASLIRTDFANLQSAAWWRSLDLDGVVLYAWGSPKFRKVAAAIHDAGIFLVLNQDNGGFISPLAGFRGWLEEQRILSDSGSGFLKRVARGLAGLAVTDPPRASHLAQGDVIACVSPAAAERYRTLCRFYGGSALANRVVMIPHPVESGFHPGSPTEKIRQVACVGRWQDELQKRPALMQDVIQPLVTGDADIRVEIAGTITPGLENWHACLPENQRERVILRGRLERGPLVDMLRRSQVFYSPSAFESFGIAAGEALCCGCSVVAGRSPSMAAFEWFVSKDSGRLAEQDDKAGHLTALRDELACWSGGGRDATVISREWSHLLHEHEVAARVLGLRDEQGPA